MQRPQFIRRRGNKFYYWRAYPKELQTILGTAPFAMSLRTTDPQEALRARPEAERKWQSRVDKARAKLARMEGQSPLTKGAAEALAVQWFLKSLETAEDFRTAGTPDMVAKAVDDAEWAEAEARRALAEGNLWDERRLARCLRNEAGFASEPLADEHLARLLGRGAVAAFEVEQGRARGRYGTRPKDPLFAAAMEAPAREQPQASPAQEAPGHTIADLEEVYRKGRFGDLSPATRQGYQPVFRLLREVLGTETPLASLTHDEGQQLFEAALAVPINVEKRADLRGRPLREQIAEGKRLGLPTLSSKSINDRYMANMGAMFRFAQARGWMSVNPVQGLRAKERVAAGDAREPFGPRLKVLFGAAPWTPQDRSGGGKPIRYWGPLLALFHGLRLGEVAGLQVRDIGEERGQPMLLLRSGKRQLKTQAAKRHLPVHPELVRLGFLDFVEERKSAAPEAMLFQGEKAFARGQWGRPLSEWFAKRLKALGLTSRKLVFHSLRHDFRDALREAEVDEELAHYLMGHARSGMGAIYGGRPSLARLQGAIQKVRFEELKPS